MITIGLREQAHLEEMLERNDRISFAMADPDQQTMAFGPATQKF